MGRKARNSGRYRTSASRSGENRGFIAHIIILSNKDIISLHQERHLAQPHSGPNCPGLPSVGTGCARPAVRSASRALSVKGIVNLNSRIQYFVLAGLFLTALMSFLPFQLMIGSYQVSPFWCLSIPMLGILLMLVL